MMMVPSRKAFVIFLIFGSYSMKVNCDLINILRVTHDGEKFDLPEERK